MIELTRDTTFKKLIKEEKGKEWFDGIIKDLIGIDLSKYEYFSENFVTGEKKKHDFYTDVALKYGNDIVIIEMQNNKLGSEKSFYYLFRAAGFNMESGKSVGNKTILIRLLNFSPNDIIKDKKGKIIHMQYMNAEYNYVANMIEGYDIILPNFIKISYNKNIEKRMRMFNCKTYEEMEEYATSALDLWIIKRLKELERDGDFMIYYDEEIIKEMDKNIIKDEMKKVREQGLEQGRTEGRVEVEKEMIARLIKKGKTIEEISDLLDIPISDIKIILEEKKTREII